MTRNPNYYDTLERHHRLLLDFVLSGPERSLEAWREWSGTADLDRSDYSTFQMLPQVSRRLSELGIAHPWAGRLRGIHKNRWFLNQLLLRAVFPVVDAFESNGIDVLLIKGVAMTPYYDNDLGLRPMQDVDLVVDIGRLESCFRILHELGWHSSPGFSREMLRKKISRDDKAIGFARENAAIDLHWRVADLDFSDGSGIRSRGTTLALGGHEFTVPAPTEQLYLACVHGLKWELHPKLLWICDGVRLLKEAGEDIDWSLLADICRQNRLQHIVALALEVLFRYAPAPGGFDPGMFAPPRPVFFYRHELNNRLSSPSRREPLQQAVASLAVKLRKEQGPMWRRLITLSLDPFTPRRLRGAGIRGVRALVGRRWLLRRRCGSLTEHPAASVGDLPVLESGVPVEFGTGSAALDLLVDSWSSSESGWTWSFGRESTLAFRVRPGTRFDLLLSFRVEAMLPDRSTTQTVDVLVNGKPTERWIFRDVAGTRSRRALVVRANDRNHSVYITFQIARPRNPARLGLSTDDRDLGIRLWSMTPVSVELFRDGTGVVEPGSETEWLLGAGWATTGHDGAWAMGERGEIVVPLAAADAARVILLQAVPYLPPGAMWRDVEIDIDDRRVGVWRLRQGELGSFSLRLPRPFPGKRYYLVVFRPVPLGSQGNDVNPRKTVSRFIRLVQVQGLGSEQ